jgi:hypothetical protein
MLTEFFYVGKVTPSFLFLDPRKTDLYGGGVKLQVFLGYTGI